MKAKTKNPPKGRATKHGGAHAMLPQAPRIPLFPNPAYPGYFISWQSGPFELRASIRPDEDSSLDEDDCHKILPGDSAKVIKRIRLARAAFENEEWFYCGVVIAVWFNGNCVNDRAASLWRIECNYPNSDNGYLSEVCEELEDGALAAGYLAVLTGKHS